MEVLKVRKETHNNRRQHEEDRTVHQTPTQATILLGLLKAIEAETTAEEHRVHEQQDHRDRAMHPPSASPAHACRYIAQTALHQWCPGGLEQDEVTPGQV